ncbi:hypothetical protein NQ318_013604 [Aromia moschata]|uniref:Uncharacterized protein n=1 Tax=Aromia moschata TaxID=1265417 RepID=A0AAV8YM09_9CUCU|nr:hypothetical protein NQ318_013604 [Aromia moschata]
MSLKEEYGTLYKQRLDYPLVDHQVAISVPGDIILGGLFSVHTKGERRHAAPRSTTVASKG